MFLLFYNLFSKEAMWQQKRINFYWKWSILCGNYIYVHLKPKVWTMQIRLLDKSKTKKTVHWIQDLNRGSVCLLVNLLGGGSRDLQSSLLLLGGRQPAVQPYTSLTDLLKPSWIFPPKSRWSSSFWFTRQSGSDFLRYRFSLMYFHRVDNWKDVSRKGRCSHNAFLHTLYLIYLKVY